MHLGKVLRTAACHAGRCPTVPQRIGFGFFYLLTSPLCRLVTVSWVLIVSLFLAGLPSPLALSVSWAAIAVFGPEDFVRSTGKPQEVVRTFMVANLTGPWTLCIANGGQFDQYARVFSAMVTLNKIMVVEPNAFNQTVQKISRAVTLQATNKLSVEVRSEPGSGMTLKIIQGDRCETPPVADAGPDQTVVVGQIVQLDGSGSNDIDGQQLDFQ